MSERRFVFSRDARRLASSAIPPERVTRSTGERAVFFGRVRSDGSRMKLSSFTFPVARNRIGTEGGLVARETTDPELVRKIDEARAAVEETMRAHYEACRVEQEVLALVLPRCKPAKVEPARAQEHEVPTEQERRDDAATAAWARRL